MPSRKVRELEQDIRFLETKVKQLECKHPIKYQEISLYKFSDTKTVRCTKCDKILQLIMKPEEELLFLKDKYQKQLDDINQKLKNREEQNND